MNKRKFLGGFVAVLMCGMGWSGHARAAETRPDPLAQLVRFVGEWMGTSSGEPGDGDVVRQYRLVMNGRYVQETNVSRYPVQPRNKAGEVHEHLGMFSYDKARKLIVLRQFHVEGFVNTYRQAPPADGADASASLVFDSEGFENLGSGWRARESYEFLSDDEFIETFELAPPGKALTVYSRSHFKRKPGSEARR